MKFAYANAKNLKEADVVLIGVPSQSGSKAWRKGTSKGPDRIRKISNERNVFKRRGKKMLVQPQKGKIKAKIYDYGNVKKKDLSKVIEKLVDQNKFPITLGGDHSITTQVLKGLKKHKKVGIIYFDAHPDFICSSRKYFGSVVCDVIEMKHVDVKSSIEVGIRAPEEEELKNIKIKRLKTITSNDITEKGVIKTFQAIKKQVKNTKVYLSIDMDVVDPSFAPGVETPVPGGITSAQLIYLVKRIAKLNVIGLDIMEVTPSQDIQDMTSHLAVKTIIEFLAK